MAAAGKHLFIYGTLMSTATGSFGRVARGRLHREARSLGAATIRGRLYDLGWQPGLVLGEDGIELVHGEAVLLASPEATFEWLDTYEGFDPHNSGLSEYARVELPIRLATGEALTAWVYHYVEDASEARPIADGCWKPRG